MTVANGIDVADVKATGFVPFDGSELAVAFVAGSDSPWNGVDRFVSGLRRYSGQTRVSLHLIGDIARTRETVIDTANAKTVFHGLLRGAELDGVLAEMNLGVSTLGLHRKQMTEACALKTREYVARGLPFIVGHWDVDLSHVPEGREFFLRVPADDRPINIERILEFAESVARDVGAPRLTELMRTYALAHMDWRPKMQQYVEFCESLMRHR